MSAVDTYRPPAFDVSVDLDLSKNEGVPWALSECELDDAHDTVSRYPDTSTLRELIAARHGVEEDRILLTTGGDDALARCFLARATGTVAATSPSFEMIARYAEQTRSRLLTTSWWEGEFPLDDFLALAERASTAVVVSPNNPTGQVIEPAALKEISETFPLVVLDAAYSEFADLDLTEFALTRNNVVVIRTLSKAFGLAGLRVGYVLGPVDLITEIGAFGSPYPVSGVSARLAAKALGVAPGSLRNYVDRVVERRTALTELLRDLGAAPLPSQGNFVLATDVDPDWLVPASASLGVGLRSFQGRPALEQSVRITVPGMDEAMGRLERTLRTVLSPEALLLDLDGVLADVSESYVSAVIDTAACFGVTIAREDVSEAKVAGHANDDWKLTHRMCRERGVEVAIGDIIDVFQRLYLGTGADAGLAVTERPLIDAATLRDWASRIPLAVVTGRPRLEAEAFLDRFGMSESVAALVAREDAPALKPDPAPLRLAMQQLGIERAWMVGDTADDIAAARAAGVVPIGVIAPGDPADIARVGLRGAALVLDSIGQLEEVLDGQKI